MIDQDTTNQARRQLLSSLLYGAVAVNVPVLAAAAAPNLSMEVWKSPTCGCCDDWITYVEANGFSVKSYNEGALEAMQRLGMPTRYGSCHTAAIGGYAVEGHVPVREILRLLQERPDAVGISVPGMPRGSPGMDGPEYGNVNDPYDVLLIGRDGESSVFQSYR